MSPKEKMVARIKALLAKTVDNGATEAEAFVALEKAQQIMREHGLSREAIEAEEFLRETFEANKARSFYWGRELGYAVSVFTGAFVWVPDGRAALIFAGRESDAIFAYWLTDALDAFVTRNATAYVMDAGGARTRGAQPKRIPGQRDLFSGETPGRYNPETESARRARIMDFGRGVCLRITQRLIELADEGAKQRRRDAKARLERDGMSFSAGRKSAWRPNDSSAFAAGQQAGDAANFNRPVNGGAPVRTIAYNVGTVQL